MVGIIFVSVTFSLSMAARTAGGSNSPTSTWVPPTHVIAQVAQASAR